MGVSENEPDYIENPVKIKDVFTDIKQMLKLKSDKDSLVSGMDCEYHEYILDSIQSTVIDYIKDYVNDYIDYYKSIYGHSDASIISYEIYSSYIKVDSYNDFVDLYIVECIMSIVREKYNYL